MYHLFNLKSFFKFLSKNKSYTLIDIFGLSISLMFVILIATYTIQELSTDQFHENKDRIYVMASEETYASAYRLSDRLQERYPEIDKICAVSNNFPGIAVKLGEYELKSDLLMVDTTFFNMFSFELIQGDKRNALEALNYAVISETYARKAFPDRNPIGQTIKITDDLSVTVNGIMKDIKNSTIPYGDIILRMDNVKHFNPAIDSNEYNNAGAVVLYIMMKSGTDLNVRAQEIAAYFKEIFWIYQRDIYTQVQFIPLTDVYFSDIKSWGRMEQGDWTFVIVLMSVGILILIFAIINYVNLTIAQTGFRAKEMAIRRLLGSSRLELFLRLILEATFLTFVSCIIGLLLAYLFVPATNDLLETKLDITALISPFSILAALGILLLMGLVAGLLPAIVISRAKPVDVVKGAFRAQTKMVFSKVFITFQNLITITLIAISITMIWQIDHLMKAPLGYNTNNILTIHTAYLGGDDKIKKLGSELERLAQVKRVVFSEGNPFNMWNNNTKIVNGNNVSFQMLIVEPAFIDMFGIKIIKDNQLANSDGYYVSMQAMKESGITMDDEAILAEGWTIPVAGFIEDIQLGNITNELQPVMIQIKKVDDFPYGIWNVAVEIEGDPFIAFNQIKETFERVTLLEFEGHYMDTLIGESFAAQKRMSKIVMVFAFIAIMISLLGLLAMSTYFIQQRSREIAVRKVFGSTNYEVLIKIIAVFLSYVGVAFLISVPVIWYLGNKWLSLYTYKIYMSPLIFIAAGLICLLISFLTVFWQSRMAANANPAFSIKSE